MTAVDGPVEIRRPTVWLVLYALAWGGGVVAYTPLLTLLLPLRVAALGPSDKLGVMALAVLIGVLVTWLSYFRWQTPVTAIQDKLGVDGWVRYASLDVDNAVGEQVRRDKERLVEYRALTRGGR